MLTLLLPCAIDTLHYSLLFHFHFHPIAISTMTLTPPLATVGIVSIGEMGLGIANLLSAHNYRVLTNVSGRRSADIVASPLPLSLLKTPHQRINPTASPIRLH